MTGNMDNFPQGATRKQMACKKWNFQVALKDHVDKTTILEQQWNWKKINLFQ